MRGCVTTSSKVEVSIVLGAFSSLGIKKGLRHSGCRSMIITVAIVVRICRMHPTYSPYCHSPMPQSCMVLTCELKRCQRPNEQVGGVKSEKDHLSSLDQSVPSAHLNGNLYLMYQCHMPNRVNQLEVEPHLSAVYRDQRPIQEQHDQHAAPSAAEATQPSKNAYAHEEPQVRDSHQAPLHGCHSTVFSREPLPQHFLGHLNPDGQPTSGVPRSKSVLLWRILLPVCCHRLESTLQPVDSSVSVQFTMTNGTVFRCGALALQEHHGIELIGHKLTH
jgi:hypothetical protein